MSLKSQNLNNITNANISDLGHNNPFSQFSRTNNLNQQNLPIQQQFNNSEITNNFNFDNYNANKQCEGKIQPCQEKFSIVELLAQKKKCSYEQIIGSKMKQYIDIIKLQNPSGIKKIVDSVPNVSLYENQQDFNNSKKSDCGEKTMDGEEVRTRNFNVFLAEQAKQKEFIKIRRQRDFELTQNNNQKKITQVQNQSMIYEEQKKQTQKKNQELQREGNYYEDQQQQQFNQQSIIRKKIKVQENENNQDSYSIQQQQYEQKTMLIQRNNKNIQQQMVDISAINRTLYGNKQIQSFQKLPCQRVFDDECKQKRMNVKQEVSFIQQKTEQSSLIEQILQKQYLYNLQLQQQKENSSGQSTFDCEDNKNVILKKIQLFSSECLDSFNQIQKKQFGNKQVKSKPISQLIQNQQLKKSPNETQNIQQKEKLNNDKKMSKIEDQNDLQYNLISNQNLKIKMSQGSQNMKNDKYSSDNQFNSVNNLDSSNNLNNNNSSLNQILSNDKFPHKCQICPYQTKNQQNLKRHMNTIHKGTIFNCSYCKFMTKTKQNLKRHVMNIHERLDQKCEFEGCTYVAANHNYLYKHIKNMHQKLVCDICNEFEAHSKIKISEHKFLNHKDCLMYCDICSYKSPYANNLIVHIKNMHDPEQSELFKMIQNNKQVKFMIDNPNYAHKNKKQN